MEWFLIQIVSLNLIQFWNVTDLNDPIKHKRLKRALRSFHGSILCLLETHVQQANNASILRGLKPWWKYVDNYEYVSLGRIWIVFDDIINLVVHSKSNQAIHSHIFSSVLRKYLFLLVIYTLKSSERRILWQDLCDLKCCMLDVPWVAMGDF